MTGVVYPITLEAPRTDRRATLVVLLALTAPSLTLVAWLFSKEPLTSWAFIAATFLFLDGVFAWACRTAWTRVVLDSDKLVVITIFGSKTIARDSIVEFEFFGNRNPSVRLRLKGLKTLVVPDHQHQLLAPWLAGKSGYIERDAGNP